MTVYVLLKWRQIEISLNEADRHMKSL
jgi:hypothetical protein